MGRVYIISGDDDFARKQRAREVVTEVCRCDEPEKADHVEIVQGDLPELKLEVIASRFLDALLTPPFLAPEKVVWLRHHPDLDTFNNDNAPAAVKEAAAFLAGGLPGELSVVIDGPGLDKRKTFCKNILKNDGVIEVCSVAKSTDRNFAESRRNVLNEFSKRTGKRLRGEVIQFLTEVIGGDSGILANELEKLACYTGNNPEITIDDQQGR